MAPRLRPHFAPLAALALVLAACSAASTTPWASPGPSAQFPRTLTDDAARLVELAARPERIVSLAPSNTEIVCALGACDRLVGVTDVDDYPAEVAAVPKVVILAVVDLEKVVAAQPDLILAAGNELTPTTVITQLANLGYPVLVLYPKDLEGVESDIALVGQALGASDAAVELVTDMQARIEAVKAMVAGSERPRTFYEVGLFGGSIYTAGADSFLASLISLAGGEPITGDARSTAIQLEALVAADPQLILLGDAAYDPSVTPASVTAREGWGTMSAVTEGRVLVMLDDEVITRPGPRIVDGLEALARTIHPELFP